MDKVALLIFVAAIVLAFVRKNNIGIIALALGVVAVRLFGLTDKDLYSSISTSLFSALVGITLLFSIIIKTGALQLLAQKIVALAGKRIWLIPALLFCAGSLLTGVGPGGVPALAIMPPLAVAIALEVGYNPVMLALIGIAGMTPGRFTAITPEAAVIMNAVNNAGYEGKHVMFIIAFCILVTNIFIALGTFFIFGGHKVKAPENISGKALPKFSGKQVVALLSILVMLFLIIFCNVNYGMAALAVAAVLLLFHVVDEKEAIKGMPWGTIVMVLGVGALLNIVNKMGGIDLIRNGLEKIMNQTTATPLMGLSAGLLSLVSSALGVVYPTLMPVCIDMSATVGVNATALMASVAAGGSLAGISPMSTGGALIIAAVSNEKKEAFTKEEENKIFMWLLIAAAANLGVLLVTSFAFPAIAAMFG